MPSSKQKSVVTVRLSGSMKASLQQAADEKGGNLSAEILHRLTDHESMRGFVNRLLDDSVIINVAVGLEALRKGAKTTAHASITNEETASLERAVVTAACASKLFEIVAEHASHALAENWAKMLADGWAQRIEAGDLAADFDIPTMADEISGDLSRLANQEGERMASRMSTTIGPNIWDICFEKDDPLRSTSIRTGRGLMDMMGALPPTFQPPPQTESERLAFEKKMKKRGAIRDAAKHQIGEGLHPGMSEDEVVDMLFGKLMTFDTELSEATPNAKAS